MSVRYEAKAVPRIMREHTICQTHEKICAKRRREFADTLSAKFWVSMLGDADYELQRSVRHAGFGVISSPEKTDLRFSIGNGNGGPKQPLTLLPLDFFDYLHAVTAASNAFVIFPGKEGELGSFVAAVYAGQIVQKERIEQEKLASTPAYVVNEFSENSATRNFLHLPKIFLVGKGNWTEFFKLIEDMHSNGFITDWDLYELFTLVEDEEDLLPLLQAEEEKWRKLVDAPDDVDDNIDIVKVADKFSHWQEAEKISAKHRQRFAKVFGHYYRNAIFGSHRPEHRPDLIEATAVIADMFRAAHVDEGDGGGPGLMEAAGLGKDRARDVRAALRGVSIAVTLSFADQPAQTKYPLSLPSVNFIHRLRIFEIIFQGFLAMGGGIGTLLEIVVMGYLLLEQTRNPEQSILQNRSFLDAGYIGSIGLHDPKFWKHLNAIFDKFVTQGILTKTERRNIFKNVSDETEAMSNVKRDRSRWRKRLRGRQLEPRN